MSPRTIGDHLRKRRMDLSLSLKEVGRRLGVDPETIGNWEESRCKPQIRFLPAVYQFLEYCPWGQPRTLGDHLRSWREGHGLSRWQAARALGLDEATVARLERGQAIRPTRRVLARVGRVFASGSTEGGTIEAAE